MEKSLVSVQWECLWSTVLLEFSFPDLFYCFKSNCAYKWIIGSLAGLHWGQVPVFRVNCWKMKYKIRSENESSMPQSQVQLCELCALAFSCVGVKVKRSQNKRFLSDNNPITIETEQLSRYQVQLILNLIRETWLGSKVHKAQYSKIFDLGKRIMLLSLVSSWPLNG